MLEVVKSVVCKRCHLPCSVAPVSKDPGRRLALLGILLAIILSAKSMAELSEAMSAEMTIQPKEDRPFTYWPCRMARSEQEAVKEIVDDLLSNKVIHLSTITVRVR
ncbi:unnamed protein product [Acanthoscelides obtectus]|uniref:Uncharacterized protein n=1 Tax=Acanthoscelides obtectus TaxID=200917 RepID=A0A9P0MHG2_ACAOB|nr:unnamed protein product [Acanthoscelides obtectus]CAK1682299.1 hypothetical protein AOBTE_LOCUS33545 [Acanthoscelides obtectus]